MFIGYVIDNIGRIDGAGLKTLVILLTLNLSYRRIITPIRDYLKEKARR